MSFCTSGRFYRPGEWTALVPQRLLSGPATTGAVALTWDEGDPATTVGDLLYLFRQTSAGVVFQAKGSE